MDSEDLIDAARNHGDMLGNDYEIGDLQDLVRELGGMLTDEQWQELLDDENSSCSEILSSWGGEG